MICILCIFQHQILIFFDETRHSQSSTHSIVNLGAKDQVESSNSCTKPAPQSIWQWLTHRPFIPNVPTTPTGYGPSIQLVSATQIFQDRLVPFDTLMPNVDPCKVLCICMQNTQHNFKLYGDGIDISSIMDHLKSIGASIFVPITTPSSLGTVKKLVRPSTRPLATYPLLRNLSNLVHTAMATTGSRSLGWGLR
jgi:hypothetical protein